MKTLEYYSARLFDTLMSNQGMQAIVELCAEFLGNPVAVGTDRLTVLYTSHNMPPKVPMSSPGIISPDFATEHSFIQYNEKAFYSRTPVLTPEQWGGYRTLLSRLMLHGEVVGYMSILFCNSYYTSDIDPLVELVIRTIESELLKSNILSFRNTTPAERLLASILAGGDSGLNSNADAVIQLGLNKQSSFYIATFRMSHYIVANKPNSIYKDALHQMTGAIISIFIKNPLFR